MSTQGAASQEEPLVTAVMLTGDHPSRRPLAAVAIECFLNQTYDNRELLVINQSSDKVGPESSLVREELVAPGKTVGELRNIGLDLAKGALVVSWDDDDWHAPARIATQAAACDALVCASILQRYTTVDLTTGEAFGRSCKTFPCGGCEGTILHTRSVLRYPSLSKGEDTGFAKTFLDAGRLVVVDNDPLLYVRTYHGRNVSGRFHVIDRARRHIEPLNDWQIDRLRTILEAYVRTGALVSNPL